jgi:hypothetical protein
MRSHIRKCEHIILLALSVLGGLLAAACSTVAPGAHDAGQSDGEDLVVDARLRRAIVEGVRKATANGGALTRDSYIGALNSFTNQQAGLYPSVTYTPEDHSGISQSSVYQVQDGKFAQVLPMTDIPQPGVN